MAPIWMTAVAALVASTVLFVVVRQAVTQFAEISTIIVLRDAETQPPGADDPALSAAGEARAMRLAQMFGEPFEAGSVRSIYTTDTRRARTTAAPLAARLGLRVETLAAGDVDGLLERLRVAGRGRTSLVVGHSNTVPRIVEQLTDGRIKVSVDDADHGSVFVVTVSSFGPPSVLSLRY